MERLLTNQLKIGMVLAEPIFGPNGKILLNEGTKLDKNLINRLVQKEIIEVAVNEKNTAAIEPNEVLVSRVLSGVQRTLNSLYPIDIASEQLAQIKETHQNISGILREIISDPAVHGFFLDLRTTDDFTLQHSANVCVLSLIMGATIKLSREKLLQLGTGAILHDIGKKTLPKELLDKKAELTPKEQEIIKEHAKAGYQTLRNNGFAPEIAKVALYHHERWDGSGYPTKLAGEKIDLYSRIVAVADVYDALTEERSYRQKYLPHEAVEFLYGAGNYYFDAKVVKAFTRSIAAYPLGSIVQLSTGEIGIVVNIEKTVAPRPIVKICYDQDNKKLEFPRQVDLTEEKTLFITKIL